MNKRRKRRRQPRRRTSSRLHRAQRASGRAQRLPGRAATPADPGLAAALRSAVQCQDLQAMSALAAEDAYLAPLAPLIPKGKDALTALTWLIQARLTPHMLAGTLTNAILDEAFGWAGVAWNAVALGHATAEEFLSARPEYVPDALKGTTSAAALNALMEDCRRRYPDPDRLVHTTAPEVLDGGRDYMVFVAWQPLGAEDDDEEEPGALSLVGRVTSVSFLPQG